MSRQNVLNLYKRLLYAVREYPEPFDAQMFQQPQIEMRTPQSEVLRQRVRKQFRANAAMTDQGDIQKKIELGEYIIREIEAMHKLRKYRHLKKNYYDSDE